MAGQGEGFAAVAGVAPQPAKPAPSPPESTVANEPKVRSKFPETWIWVDVKCG